MAYYLTAGIVFSLLAEIRFSEKQKSRRMNSASIGCTAGEVFDAMSGIIGKKYGDKKVSKNTVSTYRNCSGQGGKNLNKRECWDLFNVGMTKYYDILTARCEIMLQNCIINDRVLRKQFVTNTLFMISRADNIKRSAKFIYGNTSIAKQDFLGLKEIDFIKFLLAVWHYAIINTPDNTVGEEYFNNCFTMDNKGQPEYIFNLSAQAKEEFDFELINWQSPENEIKVDESEFDDEIVVPDAVVYGPEDAPIDKSKTRTIYNSGVYVESNNGTINFSFGRNKQ